MIYDLFFRTSKEFMVSITVAIGIAIVLILMAGIIALGICGFGTSSSSLTSGTYIWVVSNGQQDFTSSLIEYPYTKTGSQASVTLALVIPSITPTTPSLPILISLPITGKSLTGSVSYSSHSLPGGQTSIRPILHDSSHVALQYEPSGALATGAELTTSWSLIFQVTYILI